MTHILLRTLAAGTLAVACSQSDAASGAATKTAASTAGAATVTATAAPKPDTISDRADRGRVLGDASASLWVIMASDFQCPFCKQWHDADFQKIVDKYVKTGKIRLAFLNMPLGMHQHAIAAAEAAMCASVQGKFWPMHEALFMAQKDWESLPDPSATFERLAWGTGVNRGAWQKCMKDHLTLPLVQADRERIVAAHVNSTPTFFVGNQMLAGADVNLAHAIDSALAKAVSKKSGN